MAGKIARRFARRQPWSHLLVDAFIIFVSLYLSLWLRLGWDGIYLHLSDLNAFAFLFVVLRLITFVGSGVYYAMWRYTSTDDAVRLLRATALSTLILFFFSFMLSDWGRMPRSFYFIDAILVSMMLMSARMLRRKIFEKQNQKSSAETVKARTLIFGAGSNGRSLAHRLYGEPEQGAQVIGFVDDSPKKKDKVIEKIPVLGTGADLEKLISSHNISQVIVAVSNPQGELIRDVVAQCRKFGIQPQVISSFVKGGEPSRNIDLYRKVRISDLLNRSHTDLKDQAIQELIKDKCVLVTGAGGSIGSELSRQIAQFKPSKLLLLDHSEHALYQIDKELRLNQQSTDGVIPLLVDIKDHKALDEIFAEHKPEVVFHAAAYKHVHLVEANAQSAIFNNIGGTLNLLQTSAGHKVKKFVLISTDKAVNPVGVMGKTKRVCELITSYYAKHHDLSFSSVRFGNVLGSSGSLVPMLEQQIKEGGPVTLTHPDMTRYFMLIPEAVSLVLMSSTLSKPGDINVLKMGEPVKIVDIAKSLIAMYGKTEEEISILFTGVRPGEKMYEELYLRGDELQTQHPNVLTLPNGDGLEGENNFKGLVDNVAKLLSMAKEFSPTSLSLLNEIIGQGQAQVIESQKREDIHTKH